MLDDCEVLKHPVESVGAVADVLNGRLVYFHEQSNSFAVKKRVYCISTEMGTALKLIIIRLLTPRRQTVKSINFCLKLLEQQVHIPKAKPHTFRRIIFFCLLFYPTHGKRV